MNPKYDTTVARIAAHLLSGVPDAWLIKDEMAVTVVRRAVCVAREIVNEAERQKDLIADAPQSIDK